MASRISFLHTACLAACGALVLGACGGGAGGDATDAPALAAPLASGTTTLALDTEQVPEDAVALRVQPSFHAAPLLLDEPDGTDAVDPAASARQGPRIQAVPAGFAGLSTRQLTLQALESAGRAQALASPRSAGDGQAAPLAATRVVSTYSPAQVRAAYGLPALPAVGAALSATQAAQLGAGQTIYVVDAMHDPNVVVELAAFNQKFGLPGCTSKLLAAGTSLPLANASANACELTVVYATASGGIGNTAPAYNAGWATEIALDVQWAHATAPLARIVLIEAPDASVNSLVAAVKLANAMGPGIVSMSFGANEGNYTAAVDSAFGGAGMSYLAATGDSGAAVSWPAVSANVLAVGGTSLSYSGSGLRSEIAWSGTGGGTSLVTPRPSYQSPAVPGLGNVARRTVADVAFNADPSTGQYVAIVAPGSSTASWLSVGGTSLSTPQWAGVIAVANALRALDAKPALGAPHAVLYGQIASVPGSYASAFADITQGTNGSCASCAAKVGYDPLAGLGTPNVGPLLSALSGASLVAAAPVVTAATISGTAGSALSFTVSVLAPNAVNITLVGAPSGMSIDATGAVSWPLPVAGSYAVTVVARDSVTGLSGQAVQTVSVAAATTTTPAPPLVGSGSVTGRPGVALSFSVAVTASNPVGYSVSGAPAGMLVSAAGLVSWAKPVLGTYAVTVVATDSKTGLTGQGTYSVQITLASGPVITAAAMSGVVGKPLTGTISFATAGAASLRVSISGVPMGMSFSVSGLTLKAAWAKPVLGRYSLTVTAVDSSGLSAVATVPITISAP